MKAFKINKKDLLSPWEEPGGGSLQTGGFTDWQKEEGLCGDSSIVTVAETEPTELAELQSTSPIKHRLSRAKRQLSELQRVSPKKERAKGGGDASFYEREVINQVPCMQQIEKMKRQIALGEDILVIMAMIKEGLRWEDQTREASEKRMKVECLLPMLGLARSNQQFSSANYNKQFLSLGKLSVMH